MKTSDFYFKLPPELIAQEPLENRDGSRLLVYNRKQDKTEHKHFFQIGDYLKNGDVLVRNNTKVLPVRLYGEREGASGKVELLLLKRLSLTEWEVMVKPGRKVKAGMLVGFGESLSAEILSVNEEGLRAVKFSYDGVFEEILDRLGEMPLPPYIKKKLENKTRYNTVYAKNPGSAAAPTAGLHFTDELIEQLKARGVIFADVLLNVGLGTFRPVKTDDLLEHKMHSEYFELSEQTASIINAAKSECRRVIAVGTTSVRVLESCANAEGFVKAGRGDTEIFIYPGYKFKTVDALITNFHLPESTLLMLISALSSKEKILGLYRTAIDEQYRFFSFGDSMLIL